jgi:hypothetical protein
VNAMLIVQTRNGYVVLPYTAEVPQSSLEQVHIATAIEDSGWTARGKTVADVLKAHFEPPTVDNVTPIKGAA